MNRTLLLSLLLVTQLALPGLARPEEGYHLPPKVLVDLVDAPPAASTSLSPDGKQLIIARRGGFLTLKDLSEPELKLAGLRFNPVTHLPSRRLYLVGLEIQEVSSGRRRPVTGLPADPHLHDLVWSPDGQRLALAHRDELWIVELASARAHRLEGVRLNGCYPSRPYAWLSDSRSLVCRVLPERPRSAPKAPAVPTAPVVQESHGGKAGVRTYEDLLKNSYDEALFAHCLSCDLALVGLDGTQRRLASGLIVAADPSPDGKYLLVESLHRPFSYLVPEDRFPIRAEVLDLTGKRVHLVADLPLAENIPVDFDAVRTGPRDVEWRSDTPATLAWVEAQDGGDARRQASVRDKVYTLAAPFTAQPQLLASLQTRFRGVDWGDGSLALVSEGWWKTRRTRTWLYAPSVPTSSPELLFDRSSEDRYSDPGTPMHRRLPSGESVILRGPDGSIYLWGAGASTEGDRPFLDRYSLKEHKATRLWRSEGPVYELPQRLDPDGQTLFTYKEGIKEPPNLYLRNLSTGTVRALTHFPHPAPQLAAVSKELIRYKRADGVDLSGTLYLPPGYTKEQGPLPVLMWAYPSEFKSASAAGQIQGSPYRFVAPYWGGPVFFALRGYAVLDDPSFPIIGEGQKEPNDTYVEQLVMGAKAAVDELARRGVGDPERCAIGGHSYGAFTTANLLAHSDLFRAGIARSGAYNRTLTPFGFQSEERTFWEVPDVYIKMSPFTYADKIDKPLLLIHGIEDNNPGTFPIQSERLFAAIKGLGGHVRLVMLPKESHGYQARESVLQVLWEMDRWLELYVKHAAARSKAK